MKYDIKRDRREKKGFEMERSEHFVKIKSRLAATTSEKIILPIGEIEKC